MITTQDCADYINANMDSVLTSEEIKTLEDSIKNHPAKDILNNTLIDMLGDVSMLIGIRDDG